MELERPIDRAGLQAYLNQHHIQTGIHYSIPCHLQPALKFLGQNPGDFPVAEYLCDRIVSLPIYPGIQPQQVDYGCEMVRMRVESGQS